MNIKIISDFGSEYVIFQIIIISGRRKVLRDRVVIKGWGLGNFFGYYMYKFKFRLF